MPITSPARGALHHDLSTGPALRRALARGWPVESLTTPVPLRSHRGLVTHTADCPDAADSTPLPPVPLAQLIDDAGPTNPCYCVTGEDDAVPTSVAISLTPSLCSTVNRLEAVQSVLDAGGPATPADASHILDALLAALTGMWADQVFQPDRNLPGFLGDTARRLIAALSHTGPGRPTATGDTPHLWFQAGTGATWQQTQPALAWAAVHGTLETAVDAYDNTVLAASFRGPASLARRQDAVPTSTLVSAGQLLTASQLAGVARLWAARPAPSRVNDYVTAVLSTS